jgi:hypothetical protein
VLEGVTPIPRAGERCAATESGEGANERDARAGRGDGWTRAALRALHSCMCGASDDGGGGGEGGEGGAGSRAAADAAASSPCGQGRRWAWEMLSGSAWRKHLEQWRRLAAQVRELHAAPKQHGRDAQEEPEVDADGGLELGTDAPRVPPEQVVQQVVQGPAVEEAASPHHPGSRWGSPRDGVEGSPRVASAPTHSATSPAPTHSATSPSPPLPLVFVYIGAKVVPDYVMLTVEQARDTHRGPTLLVASLEATRGTTLQTWADARGVQVVAAESLARSAHHQTFAAASPLDRQARGGLWQLSAQRLFVLEDLMAAANLSDVLTAECDCLIYSDLNALAPALRAAYGGVVAAGPVTSNHLTGCVMYVGRRAALAALNRFMLECLQEDQEYMKRDIFGHPVNEMVLLAAFFAVHGDSAERAALLPTLPCGHVPGVSPADISEVSRPRVLVPHVMSPSEPPLPAAAGRLGCGAGRGIFDAAAIGVFLGGPRRDSPEPEAWQEPGETLHGHFMAHALRTGESRVFFARCAGRWLPYLYNASLHVCTEASALPIYNLHIHSKDVELFQAKGAAVAIEPLSRRSEAAAATDESAAAMPQRTRRHVTQASAPSGAKPMRRWWVEMDPQEARLAQQLWAWSEMGEQERADMGADQQEMLVEEAATAVSRGMAMAVAAVCCWPDKSKEGGGLVTLVASTISDGRALLVRALVPPAHNSHAARAADDGRAHPSLWRLHAEDADAASPGRAPRSRARRFSSPSFVAAREAAGEDGARQVWLVWSECEGSDPVAGAGGGWSGAGEMPDCCSWISEWSAFRSRLPASCNRRLVPARLACARLSLCL